MSDDLTVRVDGEEYVVRREGGDLQVGRSVGGDVTWLDSIDTELFSRPAMEALDRGDASDEALMTALRGVVQAEVERGG
jgi:hypothetical protein